MAGLRRPAHNRKESVRRKFKNQNCRLLIRLVASLALSLSFEVWEPAFSGLYFIDYNL